MIGILDYGMGNLSSVYNSLDYLGFNSKIITRANEVDKLSHLIVPGVGSFAKAMCNLNNRELISAIYGHVNAGKPYLGIWLRDAVNGEYRI